MSTSQNTAMGFTSSPGALITHNEFGLQFGFGKEGKRRRAARNAHLHPSPEPPIYVSIHAMSPLLVHTAEREHNGDMIIAFGEFLLPEDGAVPHLNSSPITDPQHRFETKT